VSKDLSTEIAIILEEVVQEFISAQKQHPHWPDDLIHGATILAEESGEVVKAALQYTYEPHTALQYTYEPHTALQYTYEPHKGTNLYDLEKELIQTAAMAIRNLVHIRLNHIAVKPDNGEVVNDFT